MKHYNFENSPCKISDLVRSLLEVLEEHGDLPVLVTGELSDEPLTDLDVDDPDVTDSYDFLVMRHVAVSRPLRVTLS